MSTPAWWRHAVVYQVYIRSFADSNGDGVGDVAGIRSRLPYLADLGVDALWITPWYRSPMADGGYDVADYRRIDPMFGTDEDAATLIAAAHDAGLRILLDVVPNHTSIEHPWFRAALAAPPGSPERARYHFRPGRGADGEEPPNNWKSAFGGPAWTRSPTDTRAPAPRATWYLHLFAPEQPDLDWAHPKVRAEFEAILRHWFDLGVDGFRIDVASALVKAPGLPDAPSSREGFGGTQPTHPAWDQDGVHEIYRAWRAVADARTPPRVLTGEVHTSTIDRLVRYVRPDELHSAFNFPFLRAPWQASALRDVIDTTTVAHGAVGAAPTWVLSNHDETRHVTRFGRRDTSLPAGAAEPRGPSDLALGTRRARAALLLMLALPGSAFVYQGEELGLPQVEDLPEAALQDPIWYRSGGTVRGRDGCRVPLPWSGDDAPFGFGPPGSTPWLPQPTGWGSFAADAQLDDPGSMLALYRAAFRIRRSLPGLALDEFHWLEAGPHVLAFERGREIRCIVNFGPDPFPLEDAAEVVLSSDPPPGEQTVVPVDGAVWLRLVRAP